MSSEEWPQVRLGDLVSIKHGWSFKGQYFSEQRNGRPIVVNIGNFRYTGGFRFESTTVKEYRGEYPPEYELRPGEILLVMTCQTSGGEILGLPGRVPDDGRTYLHNQRMGRVIVDRPDIIDENYLNWLFLSPAFNCELVTTASGSKILHTSPSRIEAFRFPMPPLAQQKAIARTLDGFQDKIELNRRMRSTLELIARAIFKSWFIDYDPVRKKMDGGQVGLPADLATLFPGDLVASAAGPIPQGWHVEPLDEVADFLNGLALQKYPPSCPDDLPVIKGAELTRGVTAGTSRASRRVPPEYIVRDGDLLFSWSGSLHCVIWSGGESALNQHLFKVTSAAYPTWFVYQWLHEHLEGFRQIAADKATTMGHIKRGHLSEAMTVIPTSRVLAAADAVLSPIHARQLATDIESHRLVETRDALLPRLFGGRKLVQAD
jgi:type I restriction enzyme, S subunit